MFIKDSHFTNDNITHGFFGRKGEPEGDISKLRQVHSGKCITVIEPWKFEDRPEADAMVTDMPELSLGIVTADCAPVLFYGEKSTGEPVIGAAHAGWGGALKGVLESTVSVMEQRGAVKGALKATIGPCIRQGSYEVSDEFKEPFLEQDLANAELFIPAKREGHLMFNLPGYVMRRLMLAGLAQISETGMDTYFNEMDYFSYRRSTHRKALGNEPDEGRQISVISIQSQ